MAPSLVETPVRQETAAAPNGGPFDYKEVSIGLPGSYSQEAELKGTGKYGAASYPNYLPTWKNDEKYPPLEPFEHYEHGKDANPSFPELLQHARVEDLTGNIGCEVRGVQISQLSDKGKDELALFVAQKKVVAFREQDLADLPISDALNFGRYFGRLHIHQTSPAPAGHPEIHLVHRGAGETTVSDFLQDRTNSTAFHSDVTYENQPPGTTFLYALDSPTAGGDTLFSNMVEAYNRLSLEFRKRLEGLKAVHSGRGILGDVRFLRTDADLSGTETAQEQAAGSLGSGGILRREPAVSVHPVVRTHPATGERALFINPQFTRKILGFKKEESDYLLKFLFDHISMGQDFHCRLKWSAGTVVVWDNRVTTHSATLDWKDGQRRHIARITPQAERPVEF